MTARFSKILTAVIALSLSCASSFAPAFAARPYPDKPIRLIIPYNAGSGVDQLCRLIEQDFKNLSGQSLTFVYKPGAGGATGITEFSKMRADGYAIAAQSYPQLLTNQLLGNGRYTIDDFDYLCMVGSEPAVFVVRDDSPHKTLKDFVEASKANPGKLTLGVGDLLGTSHIAALRMVQLGMDVNIVPFAGGPKANPQLLGGHIDALLATYGTVAPAINKMRALGVTGQKRSIAHPDLPTFREQGYDVVSIAGRTFMAPKGVSPDVKHKLVETFRTIYTQPGIQERYKETGLEIRFTDGDALAGMYREQEPMLKDIIALYEKLQK